jgi:glucose-1-phosphate thymidylyltransferase
MSRGVVWPDTGTHQSLLQASSFIETIEQRQGLKIACIEEVVFRMGYVSSDQLIELSKDLLKNSYVQYLLKIVHTQAMALD